MSALDNKNQGGPTPAPTSLTMDDVNVAIDTRMKAGIAGAFDDFKKNGLASALDGYITPLSQQIGSLTEKFGTSQQVQPTPADSATAASGAAAATGGFSPEANARIRDLESKITKTNTDLVNEKTAREVATKKAEAAERASAIRSALGQETLVGLAPNARSTAFDLIEKHVRRLDDGTFVAGMNGDNLPLDVFAKEFLTREHDYLFRSTGVSGSGATSGGATSRTTGMRADINSIRPGMSREQREAAAESILAAMQVAQQ